MGPCYIMGGCKNPILNGFHDCRECKWPLHTRCVEQQLRAGDSPEAWLCGVMYCHRKHPRVEGGANSGPAAGGSSTPLATTSSQQCAAGARCASKNGTDPLSMHCQKCNAPCHVHCLSDVNNISGVCTGCPSIQTASSGILNS